jgi:transcriptional regulator with XRE-family HTH domain
MNIFAQSIYVARLERGLSQKELALKAGVPQPNLSQIEKGRDFKVSTLSQIAAALDVSVDILIKGGEPLEIDKKNFFKRNNIEKAISCIVNNEDVPKRWKSAVKLISNVTGNKKKAYTPKKSAHLSWYNLKKSFSDEEISTILSRFRKAEKRAA